MAIDAKDSLPNQEIQKQIQILTFGEQLRQNEIENQKKEEAETRKRNLEQAGIAIFIPLFLFAVLSLGRKYLNLLFCLLTLISGIGHINHWYGCY
jgi:hypothetical protein